MITLMLLHLLLILGQQPYHITSSQTTEFNSYRNKSVNGNQIYITQNDNNVLNILQDGDDNLVIGTDLSSSAVITGDNNTM